MYWVKNENIQCYSGEGNEFDCESNLRVGMGSG